jgi:hypothetical protein
VEEFEIDRACRTLGRKEDIIQGFSGKARRK